MKKPRLADDHRVVAEELRSLLDPAFDEVGIVSDGREVLSVVKLLDPEVVVLDISMPCLNGIGAARQMRGMNHRAKVIFLTMHREVTYAARALEAGASGFVLKHSVATELITAIQESLKGSSYITPQMAGDLLHSLQRGAPADVDELGDLTPRQREVLQLVAEGRSAKEIAALLRISCRTAEFHKARLMESLGFQTTAELVRYAIRTGVTAV
jgi:DNA-binding NarL/FixJ family response regulator